VVGATPHSEITVSYLPAEAPAAGQSRHWVVYVQAPSSARFTLTVRPVSGTSMEVDDETAVIVAADMFRPGWSALAIPLTRPLVLGDALYRGFSLTRPTQLVSGETETWAVAAIIEGTLLTDFDWSAELRVLDVFHSFVFGAEGEHVG
jgi:hypothetical protein